MEPTDNMGLSVEIEVPKGATIYQVKCACGAKYAIMMEINSEQWPRFCAFCAARAYPTGKVERSLD